MWNSLVKAPELLMEMSYDCCIEIWGIGCVFEYLLSGDGTFIFQFPIDRFYEAKKSFSFESHF